MKPTNHVLLLSPYPERLSGAIEANGDTWSAMAEPLTDHDVDWLVSFGYRHIIREPHLSCFAGRLINIHISMLPWNRGADPNFWSWFDGTPKGVSIHQVDAGLDTGPILAQREVAPESGHTLRTSYALLMDAAVELFRSAWTLIRAGQIAPTSQPAGGSYHRARDKAALWAAMPLGYDTPVEHLKPAVMARCP